MKNSDRPLPLAVRVIVAIVSAIVLFPLVLAVVALVHGAGIPVSRWLSPLMVAAMGYIVWVSRRFAWIWLILWALLLAEYVWTFLGL